MIAFITKIVEWGKCEYKFWKTKKECEASQLKMRQYLADKFNRFMRQWKQHKITRKNTGVIEHDTISTQDVDYFIQNDKTYYAQFLDNKQRQKNEIVEKEYKKIARAKIDFVNNYIADINKKRIFLKQELSFVERSKPYAKNKVTERANKIELLNKQIAYCEDIINALYSCQKQKPLKKRGRKKIVDKLQEQEENYDEND